MNRQKNVSMRALNRLGILIELSLIISAAALILLHQYRAKYSVDKAILMITFMSV